MTLPPLHATVALTTAWIQSEMLIPFAGLLVAFGGLLLATCQFLKSEIKDSEIRLREEIKAGEARQREEMKAGEVRQREETRASEARQREAILEVKGELKALGDKLDQVVARVLTSRS